jgi:hypothetical protein
LEKGFVRVDRGEGVMSSIIFPRLFPQVDQAVQFALRDKTGNENGPGRAVRADPRALEVVDLVTEQARQGKYAATRMALENGFPKSDRGHEL